MQLTKNLFTIALLTVFCNTCSAQNYLQSVYSSVLGQEDASIKNQTEFRQALTDFGVENPADVVVKKMNRVGPAVAQADLVMFTANGFWLNEQAFDTLTAYQKTFSLYHEAAHYANNHHAKLVAQTAALLVATSSLAFFGSRYFVDGKWAQLGIGTLASIGALVFGVPAMVRRQERDADKAAALLLCQKGKGAIVAAHIKELETEAQQNNNGSSGLYDWWYSESEQAACLQAIYDANKKNA